MKQETYERLRALRAGCCRRIAGLAGDDRSAMQRTAIAYAALRAQRLAAPNYDNLERLLEQIRGTESETMALRRLLRQTDLPAVRRLAARVSSDELCAYVLFCMSDACEEVPERCISSGVALLGATLLTEEEGKTLADVCCGSGTFLVDTFPLLGGSTVAAFESNPNEAAVAILRAALLGPDYRVLCRDVLHTPSGARFDRIFLHPPVTAQTSRVDFEGAPQTGDEERAPDLSQMSNIWRYVRTAVQMLKPEGKAVALLSSAALCQVSDRAIRESYIRSGLIEAVVLLPSGLLPETTSSCALVVLSHGNSTVQMVDARNIVARRGREHFLDGAKISEIMEKMRSMGGCCAECAPSQLEEADWSLLPTRYLHQTDIPDGVPLESVTKRIERGAQISTAKFEEMKSDEPTKYRFLRVADIEDGVVRVNGSAEYLKGISDAAKNRCIRNGTVVLSRLGTPSYKSGVAEYDEDDVVLAPGNVYLIDVDETRMDPYFLQAFLQSAAGTASLRRLGGASAVSPIALSDLRKMIVPAPPLEEQKKIGEQYRKRSEHCAALRHELAAACEELSTVYNAVQPTA